MATQLAGARVAGQMGAVGSVKADALPNVCQREVVKTTATGAKTQCLFADGASILVSNFLAAFIRAGDEILFPLEHETATSGTQICIRKSRALERRWEIFQAEIAYATQPRNDKRNNLFVSAEVPASALGISAINLPCEVLRDYFYVGNRRCPWGRQRSFYELLQVSPKLSPAELQLAFRLRALELGTAHAPAGDLRALSRAFDILARPELRSCYDALLSDPASAAPFPYGGFGSLLVAGACSRDGSTFYASRILSFLPEQAFKQFRPPLRNVVFYKDHAIYRDARRKLEVLFDQASLPLAWDSSWNQWKHLLGARIGVKATFIQSGNYQHRAGASHPVKWQTALPSRIEIALPANIAEQIADARKTHHRFGEFAAALERIRARIESTPVERTELQKLCAGAGMPSDFDVVLITWRPDYDAFYYKQLCNRARSLYLFRSEYIFALDRAMVVETPQLGHATYLFSKPASMHEFLANYCRVTREEILQNRGNVAEKLRFMGRLIHGPNPRVWCNELKLRIGEVVDYTEASTG